MVGTTVHQQLAELNFGLNIDAEKPTKHLRYWQESSLYQTLQSAQLASHELAFRVSHDRLTIEGRFDTIFKLSDGQWQVVDYKTGQRDVASENRYEQQLLLYCWCLSKVMGTQDQWSAHLFYTASGDHHRVQFSANHLTDIEAKLSQLVLQLDQNTFQRPDQDVCLSCPINDQLSACHDIDCRASQYRF